MKIPESMRMFKGKKVFIIAAGKQGAMFYTIENDSITRQEDFKIPNPKYSDNEGSYGIRGRGSVVGAGGLNEMRDESVIAEFIKEMKARLKKYYSGINETYLLAPAQTKNRISKILPQGVKKTLAAIIDGNFYSAEPLNLIKKILTQRPQVVMVPLGSQEAEKILQTSRQARAVIKGRP